ncbi:hypothetical protein N431DRAFT_193576 [Stipitochalara longipes BDJ]|nr:hypothetical protein N431DRAFT_193576 [Stipitochalara longipes BDJ]
MEGWLFASEVSSGLMLKSEYRDLSDWQLALTGLRLYLPEGPGLSSRDGWCCLILFCCFLSELYVNFLLLLVDFTYFEQCEG